MLGVAVLVIWAVPSTRDRVLRIDPADERQRRWRAVVRGLDWLARFRVEPARPVPAGGRGPGRHRAPRGAGPGAAAEPAPADGVVRAPALLLPAVRRARARVGDGRRDARRARLAGRPAPGGAARRRVRRGGAAGALPVGERRRAPSAPRRPPSTGSCATSSRTARGCTSTTRTTTRRRRSTTSSATPGAAMGLYQAAGGGPAGSAALRRPRHRLGARPAPRARRLGRASRRRVRRRRARPRSSSPGWTSAARPPATRATTT